MKLTKLGKSIFFTQNTVRKTLLHHFHFINKGVEYLQWMVQKVNYKVSIHYDMPSLRLGLALCITNSKDSLRT
jgi:hypothetical protein